MRPRAKKVRTNGSAITGDRANATVTHISKSAPDVRRMKGSADSGDSNISLLLTLKYLENTAASIVNAPSAAALARQYLRRQNIPGSPTNARISSAIA